MKFRVSYLHDNLGRARSYPMTADAALALARSWEREGEREVRIEDDQSGDEWTIDGFVAAGVNQR